MSGGKKTEHLIHTGKRPAGFLQRLSAGSFQLCKDSAKEFPGGGVYPSGGSFPVLSGHAPAGSDQLPAGGCVWRNRLQSAQGRPGALKERSVSRGGDTGVPDSLV